MALQNLRNTNMIITYISKQHLFPENFCFDACKNKTKINSIYGILFCQSLMLYAISIKFSKIKFHVPRSESPDLFNQSLRYLGCRYYHQKLTLYKD